MFDWFQKSHPDTLYNIFLWDVVPLKIVVTVLYNAYNGYGR